MMSFRRGFGSRQLVILLAVAVAACKRDSVTEPISLEGGPLWLKALSPTDLEGTVGEPVKPVPTVLIVDAAGQVVPGIKVIFNHLHGSGSVVGDSVMNRIATTDSRGVATPGDWTLGTETGLHGLEARILDERYWIDASHRVVEFHADAKAGAPAALSKASSAGDSVGLPGDEMYAPIVRVTDRFGNNVSGSTVTFSVIAGGGSVGTNTVQSRFGSASPGSWTLGPRPGLNSVIASAAGLNSVTFSARARDAGSVTWYDMVPYSVRLIVRGSLALCEDGTFEMVTLENSDAFLGDFPERQFGKYTTAGTVILLTFSTGLTEQGTLLDDSLSFVHNKSNWVGYPLENWSFVKRP
jgi:hypothetical protein